MNVFATVEDHLLLVLSLFFLLCLGHVKTFPVNSHLLAGLVQGPVTLSRVSPARHLQVTDAV